jgi:hypothetical protein
MKRNHSFRVVAPLMGLAAAALAWQAWTPAAAAREARDPLALARESDAGGARIGEVVVRDDVALRIRFPAGGYSAPERAERVAKRLNQLSRDGHLKPDDLRAGTVRGQAAVLAGQELIITADDEHARANGTTPAHLAEMWRDNLAVAMGGTPLAKGVRGKSAPADTRMAARDDDRVAGTRAVEEEVRTKIVPILTFGSGGRIGVAQVAGPVSRIDDVKAVVQIATDYKDAARIRVMVPISTENVISNLKRVPQVSVTGEAGLRF